MALAIDFALIYFLFFTEAAAIARLQQLLCSDKKSSGNS
jgi:hypothetical protein